MTSSKDSDATKSVADSASTGGSSKSVAPARTFANPLWHTLATRQGADTHERDADAVAARVGRLPAGSAARSAGASPASGDALDDASRAFFEPQVGGDLSGVRLHTGAAAADLARSAGARAYTVGRDVMFGAGEYQPQSREGTQLLAHELAHVAQQSRAPGAGASLHRAVTNWTPPVRADELGKGFDARTTEVPIAGGAPGFDKFSVFVPSGAAADINKVHIFFAANAVAGANANDVMIHGLRAAADSHDQILIGVPGFDAPPKPGYQSITTAQIQACLTAAGRANTTIASIRLTAHSRGHRGLEQTLMKNLISTSLIERVVILDAFYQDTQKAIAGAGIDKAKVRQYDLVDALGTQQGQRSRIAGDQRILFSATLPGTKHSVTDYFAAIGYVRVLNDLVATKPSVATQVANEPQITKQLASVTLPSRGSFMTFGSGTLGVDLNTWITKNSAALDAILDVDNDPAKGGLLDFINSFDLLGFGAGLFTRYIAAHHFFVAEVAHELFE